MIKHIWSILCRRSIIDSETNNLSIHDVFEQLEVNYEVKNEKEFKGVFNIPIEYEIVSMWQRMKEGTLRGNLKVEIQNPSKDKIKEFIFPPKLEIVSPSRRLRTRWKIAGLELSQSGIYTFQVKLREDNEKDFKLVAELPLEVILRKKIKVDHAIS